MEGYTLHWSDRNEPLAPLFTERELRATFQGREIRATLDMVARFPVVARRRKRRDIVEHKSTMHVPNATWRTIDVQTALQYVVALANGIKVDGILFDDLSTQTPPSPKVTNAGQWYKNAGQTTSHMFNRAVRDAIDKARGMGAVRRPTSAASPRRWKKAVASW